MATPEEIVRFDNTPPPPGQTPWVPGASPMTDLHLVDPDPAWPAHFEEVAARIVAALGPRALEVHHVGSTSVPGLIAKPIIDIDLVVADSGDEPAYVPALVQAGLRLHIREPWWYEHRLLRQDDAPAANVHVWSPGCAEHERHLIFRDWLRTQPAERDLYTATKLAAAETTRAQGGRTIDYNLTKQPVIREIYARAFQALGLSADPR